MMVFGRTIELGVGGCGAFCFPLRFFDLETIPICNPTPAVVFNCNGFPPILRPIAMILVLKLVEIFLVEAVFRLNNHARVEWLTFKYAIVWAVSHVKRGQGNCQMHSSFHTFAHFRKNSFDIRFGNGHFAHPPIHAPLILSQNLQPIHKIYERKLSFFLCSRCEQDSLLAQRSCYGSVVDGGNRVPALERETIA